MFVRTKKVFAPHATAQGLYPDQVAKCMSVPTGVDLTKRTVAILEFGGLLNLQDVATYCASRGYKVPQITTVLLDGFAEQDSDATGEVALDVDVIAGVAQGCKVVVVFAPNSEQGFIDGMQKCVDMDPDVVSISWGGPEDQWSSTGMASLDAMMKAAAEKGIATFVASGDGGSNDGGSVPVTDYPACSPYAIACGGTKLELNSDGTRASETGWSSSLFDPSGSGGGFSKIYTATPNWQSGLLPNIPAGRRSPDVASNADPASGYPVIVDGQLQQVGGTSASAPLYAALFCIINAVKNQHVGNLHSKLYAQLGKDSFYDVTSGNNGAYSDSVGYDLVTGCGSLNAQAFIDTLA